MLIILGFIVGGYSVSGWNRNWLFGICLLVGLELVEKRLCVTVIGATAAGISKRFFFRFTERGWSLEEVYS